MTCGISLSSFLVVDVSGRWAPIEGSSDHGFVVDNSEFVMQLVAPREARNADGLFLQWF